MENSVFNLTALPFFPGRPRLALVGEGRVKAQQKILAFSYDIHHCFACLIPRIQSGERRNRKKIAIQKKQRFTKCLGNCKALVNHLYNMRILAFHWRCPTKDSFYVILQLEEHWQTKPFISSSNKHSYSAKKMPEDIAGFRRIFRFLMQFFDSRHKMYIYAA